MGKTQAKARYPTPLSIRDHLWDRYPFPTLLSSYPSTFCRSPILCPNSQRCKSPRAKKKPSTSVNNPTYPPPTPCLLESQTETKAKSITTN
ncbi:hypothetical protein BJ508DRAFT_48647 [Ascobolus immersus RN42]|uniref:Uncharacterized protein n=1 Tax=Ascobolus immersus RN42 TaxID=1160509 RepID=A0A3N4HL07_ASCIM|nr:hypothetical protein BJ508DRAFT_48647 [Ascobolus immersus RN42]